MVSGNVKDFFLAVPLEIHLRRSGQGVRTAARRPTIGPALSVIGSSQPHFGSSDTSH